MDSLSLECERIVLQSPVDEEVRHDMPDRGEVASECRHTPQLLLSTSRNQERSDCSADLSQVLVAYRVSRN